jgi:sec-independent protein translocase protein TatB
MFGFSLSEAAVVAVVALVVLGPDKLPKVVRAMARGYAYLGRLRTEFNKIVAENLKPLADEELKSDLKTFGATVERPFHDLLQLPAEIDRSLEAPVKTLEASIAKAVGGQSANAAGSEAAEAPAPTAVD